MRSNSKDLALLGSWFRYIVSNVQHILISEEQMPDGVLFAYLTSICYKDSKPSEKIVLIV